MKLKKLFKDLPVEIKTAKDVEIVGLSHNSKRVVPGHLFIARKGLRYNGQDFIEEAAHNGASAILCSHYNPFLKHLAQVLYPYPEKLEAILASRFYESPSEHLVMVGVTGTSGKTTLCLILQSAFNYLNYTCGYIGTVGYDTGRSRYDADHTTPDAISIQRLLKEMVGNQCKACALEATSHGLDQGRLDQIKFDIGVFTNLSHDHLDYHQDMGTYACAKAKLFDSTKLGSRMRYAVTNADDPYCAKILKDYKGDVLTFGQSPGADLRLEKLTFSPKETKFEFSYQSNLYKCSTKLMGRHNAMNILAAIATLVCLKQPVEKALLAVSQVHHVLGRMQRVSGTHAHVYVDFAHKPDALEHALKTLRETHPKSKIICVFGCGGDRDRAKRPIMGRIATQMSDYTIITSDNPRTESPDAIINQIAQGLEPGASYESISDRRQAIYRSLELANEDDVVLIAGKGHERYQIIGTRINAFDDTQVVQEWRHASLASK